MLHQATTFARKEILTICRWTTALGVIIGLVAAFLTAIAAVLAVSGLVLFVLAALVSHNVLVGASCIAVAVAGFVAAKIRAASKGGA